ncbi:MULTISPECIES: glycosyl hydrolase family 18 protein [Bacillus]|uniref:glycosyl hydrolase family 18 protein n=1 Tax=Bacillus TaxID=1386 RepID=UPI000BF42B65|nr:glycosyl hydrolase family 18 protein [Bacillus toyonensis]MCU5178950.1 glycosyl hydrolase family 18 protein [Bacillus toyonensis]PGA41883.1 spore protein O [Bacillus toyonensis]PGC07531.1 spore protein O [Bacillus toyonensis]
MKLKPYIIAFSLSAILAYNTMLVSADSTEQPIVLGYTLYGTSTDSLKVTQPAMNQVSTDNFFFYADGTVQGEAPKEVLSYSQKNKIKIYAALSNFNNDINYFDENLAHNVLSNSGKRTKLINQIYNIVVKYKYDGVNIDLENIKPEDRDLLTTFVKETSKKFHGSGHSVMVSVPAKNEDDSENTWTWPFDYAQLGENVDFLQVMTYDEHGTWSQPGSTISKPWLEENLNYTTRVVDNKKIIMGIPAYGNDWDLSDKSNSKMLAWKDTNELIQKTNAKPRRDGASGSMVFTYTDKNNHKHEVWYEDETSIKQKTHYTITKNLAGVSVYAIGQENKQFWTAVSSGLK